MESKPFRVLETSTDDHHCTVSWNDEINVQQVYSIVTWCYNLDWLFRYSTISESTMLELGNSRRDLLNQSRPTQEHVDQYHQTVVVRRRKRGMVVPDCTSQQTNTHAEPLALRDIYKWQYRMFTGGETWSRRNRGAKRGYLQFLKLWEQLYEKIKAANETGRGARLICPPGGGIDLLVQDLNELLELTRRGRHDQNAVTCFCHKVSDEHVLRRLKYFVDTCEIIE